MTVAGLVTGAGRVGRLRYLLVSLGIGAVMVGLLLMVLEVDVDPVTGVGRPVFDPRMVLIGIGGLWLHYANMVRRLHDCGRSGWSALLSVVPVVGSGVALYAAFTPGDGLPNRYGPPPGGGDLNGIEARLAELERLRTYGSGRDGSGYVLTDGRYNMEGLAGDSPGLAISDA